MLYGLAAASVVALFVCSSVGVFAQTVYTPNTEKKSAGDMVNGLQLRFDSEANKYYLFREIDDSNVMETPAKGIFTGKDGNIISKKSTRGILGKH